MRVTKLLSGAFTVLLGLLLIDFAFAAPLDSNDGDLVNGYLTPGNSHGTNINATAITPIFTMDGAGDKWGGAVFKQPPSGHFTAVQGTFTIPKPSMPVGQAMVQVGFGGTTDSNNYWLQVGILLYTEASGAAGYKAFHVWYPVSDFAFDDAELSISEGDQLTLRVESYSTTEGVAIIENHTTGKGIHKIVTSPAGAPQLLGHHAEWFVAQPVGQPLTNFGVVKFTDAVAYTSDGQAF